VPDGRHAVLVVDDSRRVTRAVESSLRRRGFEPVTYSTFKDACAAITAMRSPPVAGLLDVCLDDGKLGFEVADVVRKTFSEPIPLMMITGYKVETLVLQDTARELGLELREKPFTTEHLDPFLARAAALFPMWSKPTFHAALSAICNQYALVAQEARIVGQLAAGSTRATLARDLAICNDTLKSQIRSLLNKMEAKDTNEIVSRILQMVGST
jgi:FixJ family two-component response regulator